MATQRVTAYIKRRGETDVSKRLILRFSTGAQADEFERFINRQTDLRIDEWEYDTAYTSNEAITICNDYFKRPSNQ